MDKIKEIVGLSLIVVWLGSMVYGVITDVMDRNSEQSIQEQIATLNGIEGNLKKLTQYVQQQKDGLKKSEAVLKSLRAQQDNLRPLVEGDRQVIEALFQYQDERNRIVVWKERVIGLFMGIAGSLIATVIWGLIRRRVANKKIQPTANASAD